MNTSYTSKRRRASSGILATFCAVVITAHAMADTWTDESGNVWTYQGGLITDVTIETTTLTIPSTLGGNAVTGFNRDVFAGKNIVRVTIPSSIPDIFGYAFQDCSRLRAVTIQGNGLRSIGDCAFKGCSNLQSFTIPDSVTLLGRGVFSGCSAMESITIGDGIKALTGLTVSYTGTFGYYEDWWGRYYNDENNAALRGGFANALFYNCTSLKTINWGANVKTIGNAAFHNCSALESVEIPNTVTNIGNDAFFGCASLRSVKIGNGVTDIGSWAFRALPKLLEVTFGEKVEHIGEQAFQDCTNLQNFTLPPTIRQIDDRAFFGCSKALKEVSLPANVNGYETVLGNGVFSGCSALETVTFGDTVQILTGVPCCVWDAPNGKYYPNGNYYYTWSRDSTSLICEDLNVTLADVGALADGLFYNCTSLKTINWGNGVKKIGNAAFHNCSALESVVIPDTVTSIGCHAFLGCDSLANVTIGNKVTTIGIAAFRALPKLVHVTFGGKVEHIAQQAFQDCVNLQNFILPATICQIDYRAFAGCNNALTKVTIPNNEDIYAELGRGIFSGCSKLETVTFGDSVRALPGVEYDDIYADIYEYSDRSSSTDLGGYYDDGFFYNCTSLKTINWGNGIKKIGNIAFLNCSALENVTIPANVSEIGCHAFYGCSALRVVTVLGSISSIGRHAFANCPALLFVDFQGAVMDDAPGDGVFAFDDADVTAYAAVGSTGWKGVADVGGLPESGMWCGAHIAYGPAPADPGPVINGIDLALVVPFSDVCSNWEAPVFLASAKGATSGKTTFEQFEPIYLHVVFMNIGNQSVTTPFVIRHRVINGWGDDWTLVDNWDYTYDLVMAPGGRHYWWNYAWTSLQNLPPGEYKYLIALNFGNTVEETDGGITFGNDDNNIAVIYFTVTPLKVSVTLDRQNGSGGTASVTATYGEAMPAISVPTRAGYVFGGYFTAANGGETQYYRASGASARNWDKTEATTLYAKWAKSVIALTLDGSTLTIAGEGALPDDFAGDPDVQACADEITWIEVGEGVTEIWPDAFSIFPNLKTVVLPGSLEAISEDAFSNCANLEMLYLPPEFFDAIDQLGIPDTCNVISTDICNFVKRLYKLCLDREPDHVGLNNWCKRLANRTHDGANAAYGFLMSAEMKNRNLSNADFVEVLYNAMMGRASDAGGKANWVARLDGGVSRAGAINGFAKSAEFTGICRDYDIVRGTVNAAYLEKRDVNFGVTMFVARLYTKALGRGYDIGGLNNWCNRINTSRTPKASAINAAVGFFHSAEFKNRRLSNAAYVDVLYNTFLGRNPNATERANWVRRLNGGMSRDAAMAGFYNSAEFNKIMAGYGIR